MPQAKEQRRLSLAAQVAEWPQRAVAHVRSLACQLRGKRSKRDETLRSAQMLLTTSEHHDDFREMAFTFAVIALAANVSKADGDPSREEFLAFRDAFPMPATEHEKIHQLYTLALRDEADVVHHARRIATLFPVAAYRRLLGDVLSRLVRVAAVDGALNMQERNLLLRIAQAFGLRRREAARLLRKPVIEEVNANPYALLGVKPETSEADIRRHYHRLLRENHPDNIQATGGSEEAMLVASRQVAQLNAAYQAIRNERRS